MSSAVWTAPARACAGSTGTAPATVMQPQVLPADEPTGNLDSAAGEQVLALLERMNAAGLTLIMVTHDPGVAVRARRALLMRDGRIARRLDRGALQQWADATRAGQHT